MANRAGQRMAAGMNQQRSHEQHIAARRKNRLFNHTRKRRSICPVRTGLHAKRPISSVTLSRWIRASAFARARLSALRRAAGRPLRVGRRNECAGKCIVTHGDRHIAVPRQCPTPCRRLVEEQNRARARILIPKFLPRTQSGSCRQSSAASGHKLSTLRAAQTVPAHVNTAASSDICSRIPATPRKRPLDLLNQERSTQDHEPIAVEIRQQRIGFFGPGAIH